MQLKCLAYIAYVKQFIYDVTSLFPTNNDSPSILPSQLPVMQYGCSTSVNRFMELNVYVYNYVVRVKRNKRRYKKDAHAAGYLGGSKAVSPFCNGKFLDGLM